MIGVAEMIQYRLSIRIYSLTTDLLVPAVDFCTVVNEKLTYFYMTHIGCPVDGSTVFFIKGINTRTLFKQQLCHLCLSKAISKIQYICTLISWGTLLGNICTGNDDETKIVTKKIFSLQFIIILTGHQV